QQRSRVEPARAWQQLFAHEADRAGDAVARLGQKARALGTLTQRRYRLEQGAARSDSGRPRRSIGQQMTFERFCQLNGLDPYKCGPLQVRSWLRLILHNGDEYVAIELERASQLYNAIGLADPTRSDLVQDDFAQHWTLQPPRGYDAEHTALWRKLP